MLPKGYTTAKKQKSSFAIRDWSAINVLVVEMGLAMGKGPLIALVCCGAFLSGSAWSATFEPGQGTLSVNQGQGFQPVNGRIDANVGDAAMVAPGGTATIVYDDGCTVPIQPGDVATITPLSPCASGSYAQNNTDYTGALAAGGIVGIVGGVVIYEGTKSTSNNSPASP
jgi:hypothetical protein